MTSVGGGWYRWVLVAALGLMVNVGYGAIFYSFSVLLGEGAAVSEFSRTTLSVCLGLGVVVSAALALPVGAVCDLWGPRWVFFAGALLGALGLAGFSVAQSVWQLAAVWVLLLGPAMACAFYEPAYVAISQWFEGRQGRPVGVLTIVAGLSASVFVPFTQWMVDGFGWRGATLTLGLVMGVVIGALALLVVRDRPRARPEKQSLAPRALYTGMVESARQADARFWKITAAFFLALAAMWGMLFHQISYMQELGFPPATVAVLVAVAGLLGLPARFLLPVAADYLSPFLVTSGVFIALAGSGLVLADASEWWRLYVYAGVFGLAFGAVMPLRAVVMSRYFSGEHYGRFMGLQQTLLALTLAAGPVAAGAARDLTGSYLPAWLSGSALFLAAIPLLLLARR